MTDRHSRKNCQLDRQVIHVRLNYLLVARCSFTVVLHRRMLRNDLSAQKVTEDFLKTSRIGEVTKCTEGYQEFQSRRECVKCMEGFKNSRVRGMC